MVILIVQNGPDVMAVGPFDTVEIADRYFHRGQFAEFDDYTGMELVVVNQPDSELLAKAVLNPEAN